LIGEVKGVTPQLEKVKRPGRNRRIEREQGLGQAAGFTMPFAIQVGADNQTRISS
jgi:hypothetical protein